MRVTLDKGDVTTGEGVSDRAENAALLYLGRFSALLASVAIRASAVGSEVKVETTLTLCDGQLLECAALAANLDDAVTRSLGRVSRRLSTLGDARRLR